MNDNDNQHTDAATAQVVGINGGESHGIDAHLPEVERLREHNRLMALTLRAHAGFFEQEAATARGADRDILLALAADARACADNKLA